MARTFAELHPQLGRLLQQQPGALVSPSTTEGPWPWEGWGWCGEEDPSEELRWDRTGVGQGWGELSWFQVQKFLLVGRAASLWKMINHYCEAARAPGRQGWGEIGFFLSLGPGFKSWLDVDVPCLSRLRATGRSRWWNGQWPAGLLSGTVHGETHGFAFLRHPRMPWVEDPMRGRPPGYVVQRLRHCLLGPRVKGDLWVWGSEGIWATRGFLWPTFSHFALRLSCHSNFILGVFGSGFGAQIEK